MGSCWNNNRNIFVVWARGFGASKSNGHGIWLLLTRTTTLILDRYVTNWGVWFALCRFGLRVCVGILAAAQKVEPNSPIRTAEDVARRIEENLLEQERHGQR